MPVLLYHHHATGQIGCPEVLINGRLVAARRYTISNHTVEIAGDVDVIQYDVANLLSLGFTLATPRQQEQHVVQHREETTIHETTNESGDEEAKAHVRRGKAR